MLRRPMRLSSRVRSAAMFVLLAVFLSPARGVGAEEGTDRRADDVHCGNVFAGVSLNLFYPSASDFRDIYRSLIVYPQIRAGVFVSPAMYVFSTLDYSSLSGRTPEWELETRLSQWILALGAGYRKGISERFSASAALSLVYLAYREEIRALAVENSSSCLGISVEGALYHQFSARIRGMTCLSYTHAQKAGNDITVRFGGFRLGIGALYCF